MTLLTISFEFIYLKTFKIQLQIQVQCFAVYFVTIQGFLFLALFVTLRLFPFPTKRGLDTAPSNPLTYKRKIVSPHSAHTRVLLTID